MPIYEYQCKAGHEFEEIQSFSAPPFAKCPTCGKQAERMISLAAFHLKGSGWYSKDVGKKSAPLAKETEAKDVKAVDTAGTAEKKETTDTKEAKETKSEAAAPSEPAETKASSRLSVPVSGKARASRAKPSRAKRKTRR